MIIKDREVYMCSRTESVHTESVHTESVHAESLFIYKRFNAN
jgi:hypothetical protein